MLKKMKNTSLCFSILSFTILSTKFVYANPLVEPSDWQEFVTTNSCVNCNLSEAPFANGHQNADLAGANLSGSSFISGNDYSGSNFLGANLTKADLEDSDLSSSNLENTQFQLAILDNVNLTNTNIQGTNFSEASLNGANFLGATGLTDEQICSETGATDNTILPDGIIGCQNVLKS